MKTMRIRFWSAILALCLCCTFLPLPVAALDDTVGEEPAEPISMRVADGALRVSYNGAAPSAAVLAAGYDRNGKLCSAQVRTMEKGSTQSFAYNSGYEYQAMALDLLTWAPVCKSCSELTVLDDVEIEVPMIEGAVADAVASAVSQCAAARLTLEQLLAADFAGVDTQEEYDALSAQINEAIAAYDQLMTAGAILYGAANGAADVEENALAALMDERCGKGGEYCVSNSLTLAASEEEQLHWAQQLTEKYDSIQGNRKLAELGKMMGCDAREAYRQLTAAQDVLRGKYIGEAESAERWIKGLTVVKTTAKVAVFVGGAIASGGVTIAGGTITGSYTALQTVGLVIGGMDTAIDVGNTTATLLLGSDHKLVEIVEKKAAPISYASFFFSLGTLNSAEKFEKVACFGDFLEKTRNLYNELTELYNWRPDRNKLIARAKSGEFLNPEHLRVKAVEEMEGVPDKTDAETLAPAVAELQENQGGAVTPEKLSTILTDAKTENLIPQEKTIDEVKEELTDEVEAEETSDGIEYELPMDAEGPFTSETTYRFYNKRTEESYNEAGEKHGLEQTFDLTTGMLAWETYYINGVEQWYRKYDEDTGALSLVRVYNGLTAWGSTRTIREEQYYSTARELEVLGGVRGQPKNIWQWDPETYEVILSAQFNSDGFLYIYETGMRGDGLHGWKYDTSSKMLYNEYFDVGGMRYSRFYNTDKDHPNTLGHISFYGVYDLDPTKNRYSANDPGCRRREESWEWRYSSEPPYYTHKTIIYDEDGKWADQWTDYCN